MKLLKDSEIFNNINSDYYISEETQKILMNANAQFIQDLFQDIKFNSYSITALACHLNHYFFQKRCYLYYDRFLIAAACVLLAFKLKDAECHSKFRAIIISYNKIMGQLDNKMQIINETLMNQIRDQLCIAESKILKVIEFECNFQQPLDYLQVLTSKFCSQTIVEDMFYTTKIIMLDSYRTYACLCFSAANIAVACFLIATNYKDYQPYMEPPAKIKDIFDPIGLSEEEAYKKWLQVIQEEIKEEINIQDIHDCMYLFNELLFLNYPIDKEDDKKLKLQSQQNSNSEQKENNQQQQEQQQQQE